MTIGFFVSDGSAEVVKPIAIWKSKIPRCFHKANSTAKGDQVFYFSNPKTWIQVDIMESEQLLLEQLNRETKTQGRSIISFVDNATVYPESLIGKYSNIKIVLLPKSTTARLQPLDAGITKNFRVKYKKKLMRYVLARIADDRNGYEIANEIDVIHAIEWITNA